MYNSGDSIPPFLLWVSPRSSGRRLLAGRSVLLKTGGLLRQTRHRTAPSARGFPASQKQADFDRHCQRHRQARSASSVWPPMQQDNSRFATANPQVQGCSQGNQNQARYLPNTVQGAGFQGLILSFLTTYCSFLPNYFTVLLLYKKYI